MNNRQRIERLNYLIETGCECQNLPLSEWGIESTKVLHMTVGLPRSGKSTWARMQGVPVVNPDSVRFALHGKLWDASREAEVWAHVDLMIRSLFLAGHKQVILDATNVTKDRRDIWVSSQWAIMHHVFETPKEICIARAIEMGRDDLVPVIEKKASEFESVCIHDEDNMGLFHYTKAEWK